MKQLSIYKIKHYLKPLKRYDATNTLLEMYAQYVNIST